MLSLVGLPDGCAFAGDASDFFTIASAIKGEAERDGIVKKFNWSKCFVSNGSSDKAAAECNKGLRRCISECLARYAGGLVDDARHAGCHSYCQEKWDPNKDPIKK
jgi:hypothetical protein